MDCSGSVPNKALGILLGWGGLGVGLFFWSGNLQSHAYVVVFCFCWLIAVLVSRQSLILRALWSCIIFGLLGAALALPVLINQLELFSANVRSATLPGAYGLGFLGGFFALSFPHPFFLGTFRTFDLGKIINQPAAGFQFYIGPVLGLLSLVGGVEIFHCLRLRKATPNECFAMVLLVVYLLICSTPLINYLYNRISPLGALGLLILSAIGLREVCSGIAAGRRTIMAQRFVSGLALLIVLYSLLIPIVYPKVGANILNRLGKSLPAAGDPIYALRAFQATHFIEETTLKNPEVSVALVALIFFWIGLKSQSRHRRKWMMAGLLINASVILHFYGRYIPLQPMSSWTNLQHGGPSQKALTQILSPARARFNENSFALDKMVFPNEIGVLWKIHKVQGYAALQPPSIYRWPAGSPLPTPRESYDFLAGSEQLPPQESILTNGQNWGTCRYIWENATTDRSIRITEESLNDISLVFSEGKEAGLIRTDTSYPGWSAFWNGKNIPLVKTGPVFSKMIIPGGAGTLNLRYSPKYFHATVWIACADLILIVGLLLNPQVVSIRQKMLTNIN